MFIMTSETMLEKKINSCFIKKKLDKVNMHVNVDSSDITIIEISIDFDNRNRIEMTQL